jgi:flagellar FliL protein
MADKDDDEKPEEKEEGAAEGEEGAAEGAEGAAEGEGGGKGGSKKIIIIAAAAVLALVGIGAGLYFTGMLDGLLGVKDEAAAEGGEHGEAAGGGGDHGGGHGEGGGSAFVEIPPMIVNLNTDDGAPRYLRLSVQLELENGADKPAVEAVMPRVIDQFQTYLRELRVKDLRGSAGIYRLQMELLWRVNQAAAPVKVKDVLFQEILIQ